MQTSLPLRPCDSEDLMVVEVSVAGRDAVLESLAGPYQLITALAFRISE